MPVLAKVYGVSDDIVARLVANSEAPADALPPISGKTASANVKRSYTFTLSDGNVDRMNDVVNVAGISLRDYYRNPAVLLNHNARSLPIGRSSDIAIRDGKLRATVELATEASPIAEQVRALIAAGALKAASIGFIPIKFEFNRKRGGFDFHETALLEWSIVTVPALASALLEPGQSGKTLTAAQWKQHQRQIRRNEVELLRLKGGA